MLEKSSNEARMTAITDEMRNDIIWLAGPRGLGDSEKSMISRAARAAGISFRKAKSFYYREAPNPSAASVEAVRAARRRKESSDDLTIVVRDLETLAERLATLAALGGRQEVDRARALADRVRHLAGGV